MPARPSTSPASSPESPARRSASGRVEAMPEPSRRSSSLPAYTCIDHSPPRSWPITRRPSGSVTANSRRPLIRPRTSEREWEISCSNKLGSANRRCAQFRYLWEAWVKPAASENGWSAPGIRRSVVHTVVGAPGHALPWYYQSVSGSVPERPPNRPAASQPRRVTALTLLAYLGDAPTRATVTVGWRRQPLAGTVSR